MTVEQLKDMSRSFDIGAHTGNHIKLAEASYDVFADEIKNSKNYLEELLDREVVFFAYPHGSYNRKVVQYLSGCQFKSAFTVRQHTNYSYKEKYELGRYLIKPDNFRDFKLKVSGGYDWFFFLNKLLFQNIRRIASFEKK
jgi:peptidoglycan/xylan/chitin deacetylase (PgdA/CDA1 family)